MLPGELGTDGTHKVSEEYQGVAMTLIDTMSTLAILGNASEFQKNMHWLTNNVGPPFLAELVTTATIPDLRSLQQAHSSLNSAYHARP